MIGIKSQLMNKPKVVLFIDDDEEDRDLLCEATGLMDPSVKRLTCATGAEALQLLGKEDAQAPDFIFLDLNMPQMDGVACLSAIKKMENLRHTPVIICSSSKYLDDQQVCDRLGANFYLVKPNTLLSMVNSLQFIFSRHEAKSVNHSAAKQMVA